MVILLFLVHVCLVMAVSFLMMHRAKRHAEEELKSRIVSWVLECHDECYELMKKRKGNNYGDHIYRAAMKGNMDAYQSIVDGLDQLKF